MIDIDVFKDKFSPYLEYHGSLCFSNKRGANKYYFYNLQNKDEIMNILSLVRENTNDLELDNISLNYPKKDDRKSLEYPLVVEIVEEGNFLAFNFMLQTGVRLAPYYRKYEASINVAEPFFSIYLNKINCDLYWGNNRNKKYPLRFNYYLNKLLLSSEEFRNIFIAILKLDEKRKPILKDVIRTIEESKCCLLPLSLSEIKHMHNKKMLMETYFPSELNINFNKEDLNAGYIKSVLSEEIQGDEKHKIAEYDSKKLLSYITLKDCYEGPSLDRFLAAHYEDMVNRDNIHLQGDIRTYVRDTLNMDRENGDMNRVFFNSIQGLVRHHDEAVIEMHKESYKEDFKLPLLKNNTKFKKLREALPEEFILIDNTEQLFLEGENQHNCVYSYRKRISQDECVIYHWDIDDKHYTIEFGLRRNKYYIKQMKDRFNRTERIEDRRIVENYINNIQNDESDDGEVDVFINDIQELFDNDVWWRE